MRSRYVIGIVAAGTLLTACEGLKEALTAHVDVVARAGSQELSVNRLGDLLGNAKIQVPVSRETAAILADIWTGYQQLAYAAAHGDSLNDKKAIDVAIAPIVNVQKLSALHGLGAEDLQGRLRQRGRVQPGGRRTCSPRATFSSASRIRAFRRAPPRRTRFARRRSRFARR